MVSPTQVLQSDKYSEGVVIDRQGNLYFSQTKGGTITVLPANGTRPRIWAKVPGANGHKIMPDGTHIVAAKNSVVQLDANGKNLKVVAKEFNGKPLIYPNDVTIDPKGGFYFTDSGSPDSQVANGSVYYVDSAGKISSIATGLAFANGLVLTPDRKQLFVDESSKNRVVVYDVLSPEKVGPQKVFADLPVKQGDQIANKPDGMCLDAMGNLYVAHYGMGQVEVLNPDGNLIRRYSTGNLTNSNLVFGGPNLDHLFVTGGIKTEDGNGSIQRLDLGVRGLDIRPSR
ncbi:MAG: SMP-30/gluconolactonase/LRE family protein [Stigonema ocellatum SAG 48.90 = DSM 106950]|nr:SMP-30/gluconolactonase/LRE family protein [Stigonema ocellatum SAG 48.90 = DSM 106950]